MEEMHLLAALCGLYHEQTTACHCLSALCQHSPPALSTTPPSLLSLALCGPSERREEGGEEGRRRREDIQATYHHEAGGPSATPHSHPQVLAA